LDENGDVIDRMNIHCDCIRLLKSKKDLEKAIEEGLSVPCPNCGLRGRKDENCTHMTCPKCKFQFCYICGLDEKTFNCAPGVEKPIFRHNKDWQTNPKRCPMYLIQISDSDHRWPNKNDDECLDFFHSLLVRRNLKEVFKTYGKESRSQMLRETEKHYGVLKKAGIEYDSIFSVDTSIVLIRKK
jgi:ssDNA-binding Zn-finger/Zn-ribbon topoisomerase 1